MLSIRLGVVGWTLLTALSIGCGRSPDNGAPLAPADAIPPRAQVSSGELEEGVLFGVPRVNRPIPGFRITKTPVTNVEYRRCVEAGVCDKLASDVPSCEPQSPKLESDSAPVTCANAPQAQRYCKWVGGELPRPSQWLVAARGHHVQRFAWGNAPPSCEVAARVSFMSSWRDACCGRGCDVPAEVGMHARGDSPTGVSDILITPGELLRGETETMFSGCSSVDAICIVTGLEPGAIDYVLRLRDTNERSATPRAVDWSFRCVWEGGDK